MPTAPRRTLTAPREKAEQAPGHPGPPSRDAPSDDVLREQAGVAGGGPARDAAVRLGAPVAASRRRLRPGRSAPAAQSGRLFCRRGELFLLGHGPPSPGADQAAALLVTGQGLARLINEAAIKGWLHARNVAAVLAMIRGRRGARSLRQALVARDRSKGWTRSTLERAFADLAIEARLRPSKRGSTIDIGGGDFRECDVVWREQRVMGELDYLPIHETGHTRTDRRRDRRLAAAGWIVICITGDDLSHHRAEVVDDLRRALDLNR